LDANVFQHFLKRSKAVDAYDPHDETPTLAELEIYIVPWAYQVASGGEPTSSWAAFKGFPTLDDCSGVVVFQAGLRKPSADWRSIGPLS